MSISFAPTYAGSFVFIRPIVAFNAIWAFSLSIYKKSPKLLSSLTSFPSLILWALVTIPLSPACRKTFVRRTTLKHSDSIISFKTFPGPTLASWLTSPTKTNLVPTVTAFKNACIKKVATIDISSTITTSVSNGFCSFLPNFASSSGSSLCPPDISSILWIVFASWPVASVIRFAARPVGAARLTSNPSDSNSWIIALIVVVFPVPGPPVIIDTPLFCVATTACLWRSSKWIPDISSTVSIFTPRI